MLIQSRIKLKPTATIRLFSRVGCRFPLLRALRTGSRFPRLGSDRFTVLDNGYSSSRAGPPFYVLPRLTAVLAKSIKHSFSQLFITKVT